MKLTCLVCGSKMKINEKSKLREAKCIKCGLFAWYYEEQTKIKHQVFSEYFDKWVKILGKYHKLNYVDGFAGPGVYYDMNGKFHYGSPIIAANTIIKNNKKGALILIDKNKRILNNLTKVINFLGLNNSQNLKIIPVPQDFNLTINEILEATKGNLAPTFVFIDPFGFSDVKYETLREIMKRVPKPEILINFMFNAITRFLEIKNLSKNFKEIFGLENWRESLEKLEGTRENKVLYLYISQLKKISKFVFPYRLTFPTKKRTYYYLIHLTNHHLGMSIMKSSFAKYSLGRVEWLGINTNQLKLTEIGKAKIELIKSYLLKRYGTKKVSYLQILVDNLDSTPYLESEIQKALKKLEKEGIIYIERFPKLTEKRKQVRTSIKEDDIIYFNTFPSVKRKTLLYKTKVEYGNFTINHILGCSHGCNYPCYAWKLAVRYGKVKDYEDWIHPRIVSNALELLDKEIPKYKKEIDFVHLSFTTDPFMYDPVNKRVYPQIKELTLKIIEKLNKNGIKVTVLTKGIFPKDLIDFKKFSIENEYGITLVSLNEKFKKKYEPYSAPFSDRINSLKFLHDKGLKTWVSIEPYPTPNLDPDAYNIEKLLSTIKFVDKIIFGKLNYNVESNKFESNEEFYRECAKKVIAFCKQHGIKYHIKEGTPYSTNKTKEIFESPKKSLLQRWIK